MKDITAKMNIQATKKGAARLTTEEEFTGTTGVTLVDDVVKDMCKWVQVTAKAKGYDYEDPGTLGSFTTLIIQVLKDVSVVFKYLENKGKSVSTITNLED